MTSSSLSSTGRRSIRRLMMSICNRCFKNAPIRSESLLLPLTGVRRLHVAT